LATADRLFRIDRVRSVRSTGEHFDAIERSDDDLGDLVYNPAPGDVRVRLRLSPEVSWVVDAYPVEAAKPRRGGGYDVVLAVSGPAFLERLLLQLGPEATVLGPASVERQRADAASRVLARYGASA
jgi:proteasome accessory factor C